MGTIRLGCSGWDYRDWKDVFYKSAKKSKLRAYTRIFNTAEINSTFYAYPSHGVVFGWAKYTPPDFKFSVKLNRLITHEKKLEKRFILHDCGDWRQTQREKRFCKHIGALMIALPEDLAGYILSDINRQNWEFSQYTGKGVL